MKNDKSIVINNILIEKNISFVYNRVVSVR